MKPSVWPVSETFAAEIGDLDLSQPLSEADWQMVEEAFRTYAVLVFPDQRISQQQHVDLALRFGPIDGSMVVDMTDAKSRIRADIADVSNLDWNGEIYAEDDRLRLFGHANRLWHTDSSFKKVPAKASLLFIRKIPPVGGTPSSPTCAPPGMPCRKPGKRRSTAWWPCTLSPTPARRWGSK